MTDIEKGFANNCDDRRISDVQLLSRASVKREFCARARVFEEAPLGAPSRTHACGTLEKVPLRRTCFSRA
jgi:hypothetical protein